MTQNKLILNEMAGLRQDYAQNALRLESINNIINQTAISAKEIAEKTESQAVYTAMMTDTLTEV